MTAKVPSPISDGAIPKPTSPPTSRVPAATQKSRTDHGQTKLDKGSATKLAHRGTVQGVQRGDAPATAGALYGAPNIFPEHLLRYPPRFRFFLIRGGGESLDHGRRVEITHGTTCSWDDVSAVLTGQIAFQEPAIRTHDPFVQVQEGDRISMEVDVHDGQGFKELWLMRTHSESYQVNSMIRTFDLANDLELANESEGNFFYGSTNATSYGFSAAGNAKKKPGGWLGDEVIRDVCEQFRIPVGAIYKSNYRIPKLYMERTSPMAVIKNVLLKELRHRHRRLTVRFDNGRLYVIPLQRSPQLRLLGPSLLDAVFKEEMRPEFATALKLYGFKEFTYLSQNKIHQRMVALRTSPVSVNQYGYVQKIMWSPDARTDAELRREGDDYLSIVAKPKRTIQLTAPGIPYLRRGDAITLGLGDDGLRRQVVWVDEISHTLSPQQFISVVSCVFDDPYVPHTELRKLWKLKSTRGEALGNRERLDPNGWYLPKGNNKADGNQQQVKQRAIYNSSGEADQNQPFGVGGVSQPPPT